MKFIDIYEHDTIKITQSFIPSHPEPPYHRVSHTICVITPSDIDIEILIGSLLLDKAGTDTGPAV